MVVGKWETDLRNNTQNLYDLATLWTYTMREETKPTLGLQIWKIWDKEFWYQMVQHVIFGLYQ